MNSYQLDADAVSYTEFSSIFSNIFYSEMLFLFLKWIMGKWLSAPIQQKRAAFLSLILTTCMHVSMIWTAFIDSNRKRKRGRDTTALAPAWLWILSSSSKKADLSNIDHVVLWATHVELSVEYRFLYLYKYTRIFN